MLPRSFWLRPITLIHSSIAAMALEANVSEPTVNRFCRSMDTRGFPDFKLHLAQSLANGTPYVNRNSENIRTNAPKAASYDVLSDRSFSDIPTTVLHFHTFLFSEFLYTA